MPRDPKTVGLTHRSLSSGFEGNTFTQTGRSRGGVVDGSVNMRGCALLVRPVAHIVLLSGAPTVPATLSPLLVAAQAAHRAAIHHRRAGAV
jgi:hypothetical protein